MRLRTILLLCAVIAVGLIAIYVIPIWNSSKLNSHQNEQSEQQSGRRSEWSRKTVDGVELWIAWKEVRHPDYGTHLDIFAYMEGKYFNEETLRKLFTRMSEENTEYTSLSIYIYSDEEKLARRVHDYRFNRFSPVPPPKQPAEEQELRNYFLAGYLRITWPNGLQEERFDYIPDPTKEDMVKINLKP